MSQRQTRAQRAPRAATVITDDNIYELVDTYIHNRNRLPADLRNIPIGNWDVSRVTNMESMFENEETFNEPLNDWNVSNVTNMESMFDGATSFNQPLDRWDISNVTNMDNMFNGATSFSQDPNWNIGRNVNTRNMFRDTPLIRIRIAQSTETVITDDNIRELVDAYINEPNRLPADLRNIPIGNWDVSRVTDMGYLFYDATNFNEPLDRWNISNVRDMTSMFNGATSFSQNPNWNIGPNVITTNMFSRTSIGLSRRAQAPAVRAPPPPQAPAVRPPPPPQAPAVRPPPPPQEPGGVAFEIHNAFDRFKLNEFIDLIKSKTNFMNREKPLQPLIDNINANPANSEEVKRDLTAKINRIFTTLREYGGYNANIDKITFCIQYILMQPQEFIDAYIQTFISDCLKAYATGRQESCVKGVYERIFYSFRDTIATICLDQMQGTGASPLCKPEYITLFEFFYETWPKEGPGGLNEYMQEWYGDGEAVSALSQENRIESFVDFVRRKINNAARFRQAEASIRKYANEDLNAMFGGKKRRKKRSVKRKYKKQTNKRTIKRSKKTMKKK